MADQYPVVLVFEDLQWADAALLDFVEHLLDWSRGHPLYVVTLARPELADKRPTWGAARRNVVSLALEPLADSAMDDLLTGLVPGLAAGVRDRIRERAEGIPLYAVETVRMLVDRGALVREGDRYVPVGDLDDLDVPETLQALIAGRLDALSERERGLLQNASVLGKTFTTTALATVSNLDEADVQPVLSGLVRKELLGVQADPRSPERGQYGFLQSLVLKVAHDTLARRDRKALHLAAAAYLQQNWAAEEGEIVEVIASHYLDAYLADPGAPDAQTIRADARDFLTRAGERAGNLAAQEEAERYLMRAAELTDDDALRADLLLRAGLAAALSGQFERAEPRMREAREVFSKTGDLVGEARAAKELALLLWKSGDAEDAVGLLEEVRALLPPDAPEELRADVAAATGRMLFFTGRPDDALAPLEEALELAEAAPLPAVLSDAMNTKGLVLEAGGRAEEGRALLDGALRVAEVGGVPAAMLRAYINLSYVLGQNDELRAAADLLDAGIALARRVGDRELEWFLQSNLAAGMYSQGEWEQALQLCAEATHAMEGSGAKLVLASFVRVQSLVQLARGDLDHVAPEAIEVRMDTSDVQERWMAYTEMAALLAGRGQHSRACELAQQVLERDAATVGIRHPLLRLAPPLYVDSALQCGRLPAATELVARLEGVPSGHLSPFLRGHLALARARVDDALGVVDGVEERFRTAIRVLDENELPYNRAQAEGHLAEWLLRQRRGTEAEQLAASALVTFEQLGALPWIDRLAPLRAATATA
jgi:tetratricopeptide (TPR) repeat protein